ncbi:MAG: hypothetical protein ACRDV1_13810 [Actinomycetes bacterium]
MKVRASARAFRDQARDRLDDLVAQLAADGVSWAPGYRPGNRDPYSQSPDSGWPDKVFAPLFLLLTVGPWLVGVVVLVVWVATRIGD